MLCCDSTSRCRDKLDGGTRWLTCLSCVPCFRPGQCGRADGYILEGKELDFYLKKMQKKKSKSA
jgi:small subunit ribosomal protein S8e